MNEIFLKGQGVIKKTTNRLVDSYYDNSFVSDRKNMNDKGFNIINSKKRKSTYPAL